MFITRLPAFACALGLTSAIVLISTKSTEAQMTKPTILLVHGAWADSSSWNGVVDLLLRGGYNVRALPNTLGGLERDAAVTSRSFARPFARSELVRRRADQARVRGIVSRSYLACANAVPHEPPIKAINLFGLLRRKIRIAESFQAIVTGLYIMAINNRTHWQFVTC